MFEKLLMNIVSEYLKDYFEDFDASNLQVGIWSGDVQLNNMQLKRSIFESLDLPLEVLFSSIGSVKLKVPWKNLLTKPIEAEISNVFILIGATSPENWNIKDYNEIKRKLNVVETLREQFIKKIVDKQKAKAPQSDEEAGTMQRMVLKIIDNIQVKITDIHIRFEDRITFTYSWGIALNRLETYTCDDNWQRKYIDRTQVENKNRPLQKQLILQNLGVYWIKDEKKYLHKLADSDSTQITDYMKSIIIPGETDTKLHPFYSQYVFLLSFQSKLFQSKRGDFKRPEFQLIFALETINISLENQQLQQIIKLAELFTVFQNKMKEAKQRVKKLDSSLENSLADQFELLFSKVQRGTNPKEPQKILSQQEFIVYENALLGVHMDVLSERVKKQVKIYQSELAIVQAEKEKVQQGKGGWFGWGAKKQEDTLLTDEVRTNLEQLVEDALKEGGGIDLSKVQRPADYVWLDIQLNLVGGELLLTKQFIVKREGVQLYYNNFDGHIQVRESWTTVDLKLKSIVLALTTEPVNQNGFIQVQQRITQPFLQPINNLDSDKFLTFLMEMNPISNPTVDKNIQLRTRSLEIIYDPIIIVRLQQFADLQVHSGLKSAAWDQLEQIQDTYQKQAAEVIKEQVIATTTRKVLSIDVLCAAPVILIPIKRSAGELSAVWQVSLGELSIRTPESMILNTDGLFDEFDVSLTKLSFKYFDSIKRYKYLVQSGQFDIDNQVVNDQLVQYNLIRNFSIQVKAQLLRPNQNAPFDIPKIQINGILPLLDLQLQPTVYEKILAIGDCFVSPVSETEQVILRERHQSIETAADSRAELMKTAKKIQAIWRRNATIKTWTKYTGVLSEGYIYLFAKPKDPSPECYIWVRNSDILDQDVDIVGMGNAFLVRNKYSETIFATEKPETSRQWKETIESIRTIPRPTSLKKQQLQVAVKQEDQRAMKFGFQVNKIGLKLQNEKCVQWLCIDIQNLSAQVDKAGESLDLLLKLEGLYMKDSIHNYCNEKMQYIITSESQNLIAQNQGLQQQNDLILIKLKQIGETHILYNNINLDVDVQFGTLQVIIKPLVIAHILLFFIPPNPMSNQILPPDINYVDPIKKQQEQIKKTVQAEAGIQVVVPNSLQDTTLMRITVTISSVQALLVHRFTNLPLSELRVQQTSINFIKKQDEIILNGELGNLLLSDLTNYPNTLSEESDWQLIKPVNILGVKDSGKSLLSIYFRGLSEGSPKIQADCVSTFVDLKMSQININFMMQPIMRLLDFTLSQLLFSLSNPQLAVNPIKQDDDIPMEQQKQDVNKVIMQSLNYTLSKDEVSFLTKQITSPAGMSLRVVIDSPQVTVKPYQNSEEQLIIDLGQIIVTNKRSKSTDRIKSGQLEGVWIDTFMIAIQNLCMFQQNGAVRDEITLPFDINLAVEMFGMAPQYSLLYPESQLDTQMKIKSYMGPMIIQLTHLNYMFIMKCLFHNISYDDGFDTMIKNKNPLHYAAFFSDQELQKIKANQLLERGDTSPQLSFQLDAENLTAFLKTPLTPQQVSVPFFRITLVMLRIQFTKLNNGNAKVGLFARNLEGSIFTPLKDLDFAEGPLLGSMALYQVYSINQITNLQGLISARKFSSASQVGSALQLATQGQLVSGQKRNQVFCFEDADPRAVVLADQCKFVLNLQMCLNGDKMVNIDLADFKLMVQAGPLFAVLGVVAMDDPNLTPPAGKFTLLKENDPKQNQEVPPASGQMKVNVGLNNVCICAPTNVDGNVLAIRGEFKVKLGTAQPKTVSQVIMELERKDIQVLPGGDTKEADALNELMRVGVQIIGLEICICKAQDLAKQEEFRQVKKREILKPFNLDLNLLKVLSLTKDLKTFVDRTSIDLDLSKTELRICFKDIVLLQSGLNYQMQQMPKAQPIAIVKVDENPVVLNEEEIEKQLQNIDKVQMFEMKVKAKLQGVDIVILNDMGNSFTPILDFELYEINLIMDKNNIFQTIMFTLPLRLAYYNPRVGRWEPVIERSGFNIEFYQNNFGSKLGGTILLFEQLPEYPDINIILSTMFFQSLFRTMYLVKKMTEAPPSVQIVHSASYEEVKDAQEGVEDQLFQTISPYCIRNLTGYKVELIVIEASGLSKSRNNLHQPFNLTLMNKRQGDIQFNIHTQQANQNPDKYAAQKKVRVSIFTEGKTYRTRDIDMDRIKSRVERLDQDCNVYTQVKLDEITNSKILTISSPFTFVNHTNEPLIVQFSCRAHPTVEYEMNQVVNSSSMDHSCAVPVGYLHCNIRMKFKSCLTYSEELSIEKIVSSEASVHEVVMKDQRFVIIKVKVDNEIKGRYKMIIQPPFKFTNSLPKSIYIQTLNSLKETTKTFKLNKGQSIEDYNQSYLKRCYCKVLIEGFYWSAEHKMYNHLQDEKEVVSKEDCQQQMALLDMYGNKISLLIYEPWRMVENLFGCREFVIYCTGYLINQSPYQLTYASIKAKKNTPVLIPGQNNIEANKRFQQDCILMGPECGDQLSLSQTNEIDHFSLHPTSIMGVGACQLDLIINEDGVKKQTFIGGNIQLKLCNSQHLLFTKVISLEPRFIFVNESEHIMQIRVINTMSVALELYPQKRTPYTKLYDETQKQMDDKHWVNINLPLSHDYQWSGDIDIASVGTMYFQLKDNSQVNRAFFSADVRQEGCNIFIIIKQLKSELAPFKFINRCPHVSFRVQDLNLTINDDKPYHFAWDEPCKGSKILKTVFEATGPVQYKPSAYELRPDQIGLFKLFRLNPVRKEDPVLQLALSIVPDGFQKQIILEKASREQLDRSKKRTNQDYLQKVMDNNIEEEESKDGQKRNSTVSNAELSIDNRLNIKILQVNISIMHNSDHRKRPAEYLNLSFKNIEIVQVTTDCWKTTQIRVQYLNFDNNSQFYVNYPVILTPVKFKSYQKDSYFFNFMVQQDTKVKDINLFQVIIFEIDPFSIKIEDQLIHSIMEFANSVFAFKLKVEEYEQSIRIRNPNMNRNSSIMEGSIVEESKIDQLSQFKSQKQPYEKLHWLTDDLPPPSLPTYINEIIISPIAVQLTFEYKSNANDLHTDNMALFKSLASALGVALTNIDEAPLKFTGLQLTNCFDTTSGIMNKMVLFYRDQGVKQVLNLLGSLSLIGNPVGLFNNITTGVTDLIERPVEGFTKGPLEGGLGLMQGAGSLVTHTIAGAFNSVNKITGSLGSGVASLSMDQDYIKQRDQMRMQKPKHVIQGIEQAGKSIYQGFSQGISGLFLKPFEGAKKDGLLGFGKGMLTGGIGLLTKPVIGILDAASKTTEGITNTANYFEDKPNGTRQRNIRPVYGSDGYYTDYIDFDAEAYSMIQMIKKGKYVTNKFYAAFPIVIKQMKEKEKDKHFLLIMTVENIFYMSEAEKKKIWIIPVKMVSNIEKIDKGLKIRTKQELQDLKDKKEAIVEIQSEDQRDEILDQTILLKELVDYLQ